MCNRRPDVPSSSVRPVSHVPRFFGLLGLVCLSCQRTSPAPPPPPIVEATKSSLPAGCTETPSWKHTVLASIQPNLQVYYDFEHPSLEMPQLELDQGLSKTNLSLINGGTAMRIQDAAHPCSRHALRVMQISPKNLGNDDWKAGVFNEAGLESLSVFASLKEASIMAWIKRQGDGPAFNTQTPADPQDLYNSMGLAGVLSGDSDGHSVRFLIEIISIDGKPRFVALGRRLDGGRSQIYIARQDYQTILPKGVWVHIAAVFNFATGEISLYKNGKSIAGFYRHQDNPWEVPAEGAVVTSPSYPRGIKIGGSFPQNTREKNPGQSLLDDVMFIDRALSPSEISQQYKLLNTN